MMPLTDFQSPKVIRHLLLVVQKDAHSLIDILHQYYVSQEKLLVISFICF